MFVYIGNYKNYFGPYQLAEKLLFWKEKDSDEVDTLGKRLDKIKPLKKFLDWLNSGKRTEIVKLHKYDSWNADHTLALIILPLLKQLKDTKHGAPHVDDEDVPEELRSTAPGAREGLENDYDLDHNWFKRWDWIMDEIIWAFEQMTDEDSDSQFFKWEREPSTDLEDWEDFISSRGKCEYDKEGHERHQERIRKGLMFFGKYYQGMWD